MKVSKTCPLRRLMQEWCKRYNEAAGDLTFSYNGEVILHADGKTPVSVCVELYQSCLFDLPLLSIASMLNLMCVSPFLLFTFFFCSCGL